MSSAAAPRHLHKQRAQAVRNLEIYIKAGQKLATFGTVVWEKYRWDISEFQSTRNAAKQRRAFLVFSQHANRQIKARCSIAEERPFTGCFMEFAKSFVKHRHTRNPKTAANHMTAIRALRYLYATLEAAHYDATSLTQRHFLQAAGAASRRETSSSAYRIGVHLEEMAREMDRYHLTRVQFRFRNPIPRTSGVDRNTVDAKARRDAKLPSEEVFLALSRLSNRSDLARTDRILIRCVELFVVTGFRMSELVELALDCLIREEAALPSVSDVTDSAKRMRLAIGYKARKGGGHSGKWVPDVAIPLVERAIHTLKTECASAREVAAYIEKSKYTRLSIFSQFSPSDLVSLTQLEEMLALKTGTYRRSNTLSYLKRRGIKPFSSPKSGENMYRVVDVERGLMNDVLRKPLVDVPGRRVRLSEALILLFRYELNNQKSVCRYSVRPLSEGQMGDFLCGRPSAGIKSVFERYGCVDQTGKPLRVTTHQFRHWLNTIAQEGQTLSEIEIARWMGRKNVTDNAAYDHVLNPINRALVVRKMLVEGKLGASVVQDQVNSVPVVSRDQVAATHTMSVSFTDFGVCFADFAQTPCHKHLACLSGCSKYGRTIGDKSERRAIRVVLNDARASLAVAKKEMDEGAFGANNWVKHQERLVAGAKAALAVDDEDDDAGEDQVHLVFPDGVDRSRGES